MPFDDRHVHHHAHSIMLLPDPRKDGSGCGDGWFRREDIRDDITYRTFRTLGKNGILEQGDRVTDTALAWGYWWRVRPDAYCEAERYRSASGQTTLPCGHTGVHNVRNGGFECSSCGTPITRDQAKGVL